jgi:uncharacterized protein
MADAGTDPLARAPRGREPRPAPERAREPPPPAGRPPTRGVGAREVRLRDDSFFAPYVRRNLEVALFHGHEQLERSGAFENFRIAAGRSTAPYRGVHYFDSDVYKWLEAASLALREVPRGRLDSLVDGVVADVAAAQRPDGYLQTQYQVERRTPWTNLADDHELYCAGHLIEAACAHHAATGSRALLDVALRFAALIDATFGPGRRAGCCGHPEIETALVQLERTTGERRWLELARFFLDERGRTPPRAGGDEYHQDHRPVREQRSAVGHAVRQLYLASGMVDVAAETGERELLDAALAIVRDIDACKLYVTGGVGARHDGESFGRPFELPNQTAYAESCASIALMRLSRQLLLATGDAGHADRLETTLFNAFLSATGLDARSFFYVNPLESTGARRRAAWFACACCPPNVMRTLAGLTSWFAHVSDDTLFLSLFDGVDVATTLADGRPVALRVETGLPWSGAVKVEVVRAPAGSWTLALRRPAWARGGGWIRFDSPASGTTVAIDLPMAVEPLRADARVSENAGKVALRRGPLVYAFESPDQPDVDLFATAIDLSAPIEAVAGALPVAGAGDGVVLRARGVYRGAPPGSFPADAVALTAIPCWLWANRGDSKMRIWLPFFVGALAGAAPAPAQVAPGPRPESVFALDAKFLTDNADVVVLELPSGGRVAVSPKLSGRVMTSAFSDKEPGFGLINRELIGKPPVARGFNNFGGEDRLWLAPEGGPYGLYFDAGAKQELANWYVPLAMDGGPRTVAAKDATSVTFRDRIQMKNVKNVAFDLTIERRVELLDREALEALLGVPFKKEMRFVAFRTTNTLKNESKSALPEEGLIAPWILGQFKPSAVNTVLLPFKGAADVIKKDYFGVVPEDRLKLELTADGGVARFKADGQMRTKIGVSAAGALGWLGAWDAQRGVLTLVNHSLPPAGAVVPDCNWIDPNPKAKSGDVATSYNHGQEPRFFELESIGPVMPAQPGGAVTHVQTTIHLTGDLGTLAALAAKLLHAKL